MPKHKIHLKCPLRHAWCPPLPSVPHLVIFRASKAPTSHGVSAGAGAGMPQLPSPPITSAPRGGRPSLRLLSSIHPARWHATPTARRAIVMTPARPPLHLRLLRPGLVCPPENLRSPEGRGGSEGARSLRRKTSPGISPSPFTKGFSSEALVLNYFYHIYFRIIMFQICDKGKKNKKKEKGGE